MQFSKFAGKNACITRLNSTSSDLDTKIWKRLRDYRESELKHIFPKKVLKITTSSVINGG